MGKKEQTNETNETNEDNIKNKLHSNAQYKCSSRGYPHYYFDSKNEYHCGSSSQYRTFKV
jgi:hypothetical protein